MDARRHAVVVPRVSLARLNKNRVRMNLPRRSMTILGEAVVMMMIVGNHLIIVTR